MATKTYKEGNITYTNDGKNIYKNGNKVSSANYKYVPTQIGGSRVDTSNRSSSSNSSGSSSQSAQSSNNTSNLSQFLQKNQAPTADYSSAKNVNVDPSQFSWYSDMQNNAYEKYASMTDNQIASIRAQAQQQKDYLNQQLTANRQKYEAQYNTQVNQANNDFSQQKANIEQQVYKLYDRANTQASSKGVATSGQNQAMANSVAQYAIGQHNSNAANRDSTLSSLYAKLMEQNADLDSDYAQNSMSIDSQANSQINSLNQALASQYLDTQGNIASGLASLTQEERSRLSSLAQAEAQSNYEGAMQRYGLQADDASALDTYNRQVAQAATQQQYDMAKLAQQQTNQKELLALQQQYTLEQMAKEQAYNQALAAQKASYSSGGGGGYYRSGGSGSKSSKDDDKTLTRSEEIAAQDAAMTQALYEYYCAKGYKPTQAALEANNDLYQYKHDAWEQQVNRAQLKKNSTSKGSSSSNGKRNYVKDTYMNSINNRLGIKNK